MNKEYKRLVLKVLTDGANTSCRNGKQLIIPHYSFSLDFSVDSHKLLLRKMYYTGVEGEFKTLTSEEPLINVSQFVANGCNYWGLWADEDGSMNLDYYNMLKPQLSNVIKSIKSEPASRRHVIELWNYKNLEKLSLACCWHGLTFSIISGVLHLKWVQRSVDVMLGLPADIYLAYKFMELIAVECELKVGTCLFALSNVHIYEEHIVNARKLLYRTTEDYNIKLDFKLKA